MPYLVNITVRAERDVASLYEEIDAEHSGAALKWYKGLKKPSSAWKSCLAAARRRLRTTGSDICYTAISLMSIV
jgi:hypothetical protein